MIIGKEFYDRYTPKIARDLLGCFLVRKYRGKVYRAMITETEAYRGEYDLACHASKGRTSRTETLYAEPGTVYVYLIYGMYHMLNIVTEAKDFPAAVLIRGVELVGSKVAERPRLDGPGKLTKFLHIDRSLNGHDATMGEKLWLEAPEARSRFRIVRTPRIGIDYARHCRNWQWNYKLLV